MSKKNKTVSAKTQLSKKQLKQLNDAIEEACLLEGESKLDPSQVRLDLFKRFEVSSLEEIEVEHLLPVLNWIELAWPQLEAQRRLRVIWNELRIILPLMNNSVYQAETFVL